MGRFKSDSPGGYAGKTVLIDLSRRAVEILIPASDELRMYVGGSTLAAKYLYDMTGPSTDPLGPENVLIFMTGPLTATNVTTANRHSVVSKSPLTGIWAESDAGGSWGLSLKKCGYDGIIIRGRSSAPSIILIRESGIELLDADGIWGLDTFEADRVIKEKVGPKASVACIGPAGERRVPIAGIMHDGKHARAAGRCGLGAVMGSKLLKAVAILPGAKMPQVADPARLECNLKILLPKIVQSSIRRRELGTAGGVITNAELADMPAKNWSVGRWVEGATKISGEQLKEKFLTRRYYCPGCVIGCGRVVKITRGRFSGSEAAGPEYESIAGFGTMCLVDDLEGVIAATDMCNRLGVDTISGGAAIAFAMEAYEKGLISKADTGGIALKWGDVDAVLWLIERIGYREGIGELLGLGVKRASEALGGSAKEFAIHVKGLELPYHDPRALSSLALAYATYHRGACHRGCSHTLERMPIKGLGFEKPLDRFAIDRKAEAVIKMQDYSGMFNALKLCNFIETIVDVHDVVEWLNIVTGFEYSIEEFLRAGERGFNLKRMYNVRLGVSRKDDCLPPRITTLMFDEGGATGHLPHLGKMLAEYYRMRGWSEEGIPLPSKLESLGLSRFVNC